MKITLAIVPCGNAHCFLPPPTPPTVKASEIEGALKFSVFSKTPDQNQAKTHLGCLESAAEQSDEVGQFYQRLAALPGLTVSFVVL